MRRNLSIMVVLFAILLLTACSPEEGRYSGTLVAGGSHEIGAGETLEGGLLVTEGRVKIERGSLVTGTVYVMGGEVSVDGEIHSDLSMIGGEVSLGPRAKVSGDLDFGGGNLTRSPEAKVTGEVNRGTGSGVRTPLFPGWTIIPTPEDPTMIRRLITFVVNILLLSTLAALAARFLPRPVSRVARAVVEAPVVTGALGLLAMITIPSLLVLMAFTVILIPVVVLGALLLGAIVVYGWVSIGTEIGRLLVQWRGWNVRPAASAFLGTLVFTLFINGSGFIPVVGTVVSVLAASLGFGAVLLTRFGMRTFVSAAYEPQAEISERQGPV
ncbi:MAG: hypothetical protein WA982_00785 [Rubrobacteraceae bacterium]